MNPFYPEGWLIDTTENNLFLKSITTLGEAHDTGRVLESRVLLCDSEHNLVVGLGSAIQGVIPRNETAIGIQEGTTRDIAIISRVNKPVAFKIIGFEKNEGGGLVPILSRRAVQEEALGSFISNLHPGDLLPARVTHLEPFGAFVDICCGLVALLPIDAISISRISHPKDRFKTGQDITVVVKSIDEQQRVTLSHKELLGTWEQNAKGFSCGQTVPGIIRSVEEYGVFVELSPNLAGLAEPREGVQPGQHASVYIKSIIEEKMKIKLYIVDAFDAKYPPAPIDYFITSGHLDYWRYSPFSCEKVVESVFNG